MYRQRKGPLMQYLIKQDDPVFRFDYNEYFLRNREWKHKYYSSFIKAKIFLKSRTKLDFDPKTYRKLQKTF